MSAKTNLRGRARWHEKGARHERADGPGALAGDETAVGTDGLASSAFATVYRNISEEKGEEKGVEMDLEQGTVLSHFSFNLWQMSKGKR